MQRPARARPATGRLRLATTVAAVAIVAGACSASEAEDADPTASSAAEDADPTVSSAATEESAAPSTSALAADSTSTAATTPAEPTGDGGCGDVSPGLVEFTSEAGGVPVRVRVVTPAAFDGTPLPAVLDWHGLGSSGDQQASLTAYPTLAGVEGFVAVHPTGAPVPGDTNNAWELAQFDTPGRDDLAMFDEVVDRLIERHCVDGDRIYSTGMSNGGFFTARLVCERADRIAAAVSVAGVSHPDGCRPSRPVPYLAFHGTADAVVPFAGGRSSLQVGPSTPELDAFFGQVMPDEFAEFAADFGCDPDPDEVAVGDEVIRYDYRGCRDGVPLSFYEITGGGHTWPGSGLGPLLAQALGPTTDDVDATAEGWAFMSQFSLD